MIDNYVSDAVQMPMGVKEDYRADNIQVMFERTMGSMSASINLSQNNQSRNFQQGASNLSGNLPSSNIHQHDDSLYSISVEILKLQNENVDLRAQLRSIHILLTQLMERKNTHEFYEEHVLQSKTAQSTPSSAYIDNMILNIQRNLNIGGPSSDNFEHKNNEKSITERNTDDVSNTYNCNYTSVKSHSTPIHDSVSNTKAACTALKTHYRPGDYVPEVSLSSPYSTSLNAGSTVSKRIDQVTNDSINLITQQGTVHKRNLFDHTLQSSDISGGMEFNDTNPFKLDIMADTMPITETTKTDLSRDRGRDSCNNSSAGNTNQGRSGVIYQPFSLENITEQRTTAKERKAIARRRAVFKTTRPGKYYSSKLKKSTKRSVKKRSSSSLSLSPPNGKLDDDCEKRDVPLQSYYNHIPNHHVPTLANRLNGITGLLDTAVQNSLADEGYDTRPSTCTLRHSPEFVEMSCNGDSLNFAQSNSSRRFLQMPTYFKSEIQHEDQPFFQSQRTNQCGLKESSGHFQSYNETILGDDDRDLMEFPTSNSVGSSLRFYAVVLTSTVAYIFHYKEIAWMSVNEFFNLFTKYKSRDKLLHALQAVNVDFPLEEIERLQEPHVFLQLDSTSLKAPRNAKNQIESICLMPLKLGMRILTKLNVLLPQDINIDNNEKPFSFNSLIREMSVLIEAHDTILENMRASST